MDRSLALPDHFFFFVSLFCTVSNHVRVYQVNCYCLQNCTSTGFQVRGVRLSSNARLHHVKISLSLRNILSGYKRNVSNSSPKAKHSRFTTTARPSRAFFMDENGCETNKSRNGRPLSLAARQCLLNFWGRFMNSGKQYLSVKVHPFMCSNNYGYRMSRKEAWKHLRLSINAIVLSTSSSLYSMAYAHI